MLRIIVAVLASLEMLVVIAVAIGGFMVDTDPAGEGIAMGAAVLSALVGLAVVVPALLAAYHNRRLWLGLALTLLPLLPVVLMIGL